MTVTVLATTQAECASGHDIKKTTMTMTRNTTTTTAVAALLLALALAVTVSACGGGTLNSSKRSSVRLLNATTDYATLDLVASGSTGVASAVASYAASGYAELDAGSLTFALRVPGSGSAFDAASTTVSVVKDGHTALLAYASGGALKMAPLSEDDGAPAAGKARLRILNTASVEAGALDLYVLSTTTACSALPASTPAAASALTVASSVAVEVNAAGSGSGGTAYNLCLFATGNKTDLRLAMPNVNLADQQVTTLVVAKAKGGVLVNGLLLNQQGSLAVSRNASARVRVAAGVAGAGVVSASAAPAGPATAVSLVAGLTSPNVGSYVLVPAGDLGLTLNGALVAGKAVEPGDDLTLIVTGSDAASVYSLSDDNTPSTSSSSPVKLRLVNGATGGALLTVDAAPVAAASTATGKASAPVTLAATAATSVLAVTSNGLALPALTGQSLASGKVYSLFVLGGDKSGLPSLILRADRP